MSLIRLTEALGMHRLEKTVTFSNTGPDAIGLFVVTGDVIVRIIPICKGDIQAGGTPNIRLGIIGADDAMISDTVATDLEANEIWTDVSPDSEIEPVDSIRSYIISNGNGVILTLDAEITSGQIVFYCFWSPLSTNGEVALP